MSANIFNLNMKCALVWPKVNSLWTCSWLLPTSYHAIENVTCLHFKKVSAVLFSNPSAQSGRGHSLSLREVHWHTPLACVTRAHSHTIITRAAENKCTLHRGIFIYLLTQPTRGSLSIYPFGIFFVRAALSHTGDGMESFWAVARACPCQGSQLRPREWVENRKNLWQYNPITASFVLYTNEKTDLPEHFVWEKKVKKVSGHPVVQTMNSQL